MSSSSDVIYCELCGAPIPRGREKRAFIEGSVLVVCNYCYSKLVHKNIPATQIAQKPRQSRPLGHGSTQRTYGTSPRYITGVGTKQRRVQRSLEKLELVEDYAERIREARERLGWSQKVLAEKVRESESVIKRIESGRLRPTIELAKKLEEVLGIKLLVPQVEEEMDIYGRKSRSKTTVTLGEIVSIREE